MGRAAAAAATHAGGAAPAKPRRVSGRAAPAKAAPRRKAMPRRKATPRRKPVALPLGARLLDTLLSGRIWIGLVGVLLAGIVFFNVDLMRMNREITHMADRAAQLKRENGALREDVAGLASSERIQQEAAKLGLVLPQPSQVRYLKSNPSIDARTASKRIIAPTPTVAPDPTVPETTTPASPTG
jgi:cell division protein FtsL